MQRWWQVADMVGSGGGGSDGDLPSLVLPVAPNGVPAPFSAALSRSLVQRGPAKRRALRGEEERRSDYGFTLCVEA